MGGSPERAHERLRGVGEAFEIEGRFAGAAPHGSGHIHETWLAAWDGPRGRHRSLHQRLNTGIFRDPVGLMQNVGRVTEHLARKLRARGLPDPERRCPTVVPTRKGGALHVDPEGGVWRTFRFIEGTRSLDTIEAPGQAFEAARAFGGFAEMLADLSPAELHDTIPHFHDMPRRREAFERAVREDPCQRARAVREELEALRACASELELRLPAGHLAALPRRIVHHDCKLNNLLFDAASGEALCVIDLDTVMAGTLLSDFGELVRTAASPAAEDERELSRVELDLGLAAALARGYLAGCGELLSSAERSALPLAGAHLTLMNALRFLTDHLQGDVYFRVHQPGHNLDRARAQLRLGQLLLAGEPELRAIVQRAG